MVSFLHIPFNVKIQAFSSVSLQWHNHNIFQDVLIDSVHFFVLLSDNFRLIYAFLFLANFMFYFIVMYTHWSYLDLICIVVDVSILYDIFFLCYCYLKFWINLYVYSIALVFFYLLEESDQCCSHLCIVSKLISFLW